MRKDESGSGIRVKQVSQMLNRTPIAIAPKPVPPKEREVDYSMLNKPPPIPFFLPKSAANAPRQVSSDPLNDPPEIAVKKLETEATTLKEEVAALKWLAKRKEQEWNTIIELLKKKEETWLKVKRQAELASSDKGFQKLKATLPSTSLLPSGTNSFPTQVVMPEAPPPIQIVRSSSITASSSPKPTNVMSLIGGTPSPVTSMPPAPPGRKVLVPVSQPLTAQAIQALSAQGLLKSGGVTPDGKRIIVVKKSASGALTLPKNSGTIVMASGSKTFGGQATKVVMTNASAAPVTSTSSAPKRCPLCVECQIKPSKFECAGCSKTWYCSKECQEKNWPTHEKKCGVNSTVVKQEIIDD